MRYLILLIFVPILLLAQDSKFKMGRDIYIKTCISCHGGSGTPSKNLNFIVSPRDLSKTVLTEQQTYEIIKHGTHYWGSYSDMMPAFKYVYNDAQLHAVAYYISTNFNKGIEKKIENLYSKSDKVPKDKESKMLKRGEKIYKRNCSWCHGLDAKGDGEATRNPEKSIYPYNLGKTLLTNKQMFLYAKYGGKYWGTHKNDMPNWSKKYDDFTLKSVVKYIDITFRKNKNDDK